MTPPPDPAAEAARYALLRRLAPSFRHHLVVNLQPIGMIYEVMDRRLRAATPDLAHVQDSANRINGFAKAALSSCIDVVSWLAPDDEATTSVHEGVRECCGLMATGLSFRGYALRNEVPELAATVRRSALRNLLPAILMYSTDHLPAPADLVLEARTQAGEAIVSVEVRTNSGENTFRGETGYRKLEWRDLEALAAADSLQLRRDGQRFELRVPLAP